MSSRLPGSGVRLGFGWLRFALSGRGAAWLPLRLSVHIVLMLAVATGVSLIVWAWFGAPDLSGPYSSKQRLEVAKLVLTVTAGLGGIVALVVAYRKQRLSESTEAREDTRAFQERFTAASEQLSSDRVANRLAGVYSMSHLADDWDTGRQTCINVLCAYMRMPYELAEEIPEESTRRRRAAQEEGNVRSAIMDTVGERLRLEPVDGKTWHGHVFDFSRATIHSGRLQGIKITGGVINFTNARFPQGHISFRNARFDAGVIDFDGAEFSGGSVNFRGARFRGASVSFDNARFTAGDIEFREAEFGDGEVSFRSWFAGGHTEFWGARFRGAHVSFDAPEFSGGTVSFNEAQFSSGTVDFNSTFSGASVSFGAALFSGGTVSFVAWFTDGDVRFGSARFSGAYVDFRSARFRGSRVDFNWVADWSKPPHFEDFLDGLPAGLMLPAASADGTGDSNREATATDR